MTTEGTDQPLLWRMAGRARPEPEPVVTPTRALRIALTRAAEQAAGLTTTALGVSDDILPLPDLLARLADGWLFLRIDSAHGPGLIALDPGLLQAVVEMQMRGRIAEVEPESRPLTGADAALAAPLVTAFLAELALAATGSALAGWADGCLPGGRIADLRAIGLVLPEREFRAVGLSAWLGAGDRQGQILLALPQPERRDPALDAGDRAARWSVAFQDNVLSAVTAVDAILHRMPMALGAVQALHVGQQIVLPGVRVTSVRVEGADGRLVGRGRLGQSGGMRAVRIEPEPLPEMSEAAPAISPPRTLATRG